MSEDPVDPAVRALLAEGGELLEDGSGVYLHGWTIRSHKATILGSDGMEALERELGVGHLPEMVFGGSGLEISHAASGAKLSFTAADALRGWKDEALPALQLREAGEWQGARDLPPDLTEVRYDWTFTTGYVGGAEVAGGEPATWEPCSGGIDRARLMRRDPILFFDEIVLYESELDDNGVSQCSVKVRVMPHCWYVLLRFWLRVDGNLIRLRETRVFCPLRPVADGGPGGGGGGGGAPAEELSGVELSGAMAPVVRECTFREGTFEELRSGGAPPPTDAVYSDPDAASQVLQAVAPVGVKKYWTERLVVPS